MPRIPDAHLEAYERFTLAPSLVRQTLTDIDPALLNRRPPAQDWSMRDVVIHLTDAELVRAVQFRLALTGDEAALPDLPTWDADRWKRKLLYVFRDAEAALSAFQQTRFGATELLRECAPEAWERAARHPEHGAVTVGELLAHAVTHDAEHIAQLQALRGDRG